MNTLTKKQREYLIQNFSAPMLAAKEQHGLTGGGCGFRVTDAIVLSAASGIEAYEKAVDILHDGLGGLVTNSRRSHYRGRRLLALCTETELNGKRTEHELWFDLSSVDLTPETVIDDEDDLCSEVADVVCNGSLGQLLFLLDDTAQRSLLHHTRYNLYSSDQNELVLLYAVIAAEDMEILGILLARTELSLETCDEEGLSLIHYAYANEMEDMIALLHEYGLPEDYDPNDDPYYAYYIGEEEEEEEEE